MKRNIGMVILVLLSALSAVISVSVFFQTEDPFPRDANILISTFGVGMAALSAGIVLGPFRRGERWAIWLLAVWPIFFLVHALALGTWIPDGIFLVLAVIALALGASRQSERA